MTLASNLRDNKVFYTVAGAGDFAVEKLREVPEQFDKARENAEKYRTEVRRNVEKYRAEARKNVEKYRAEVRKNVVRYREEAEGNVGRLQERVELKDLPNAASSYVTQIGSRTVEFIDGLAERGKKVVHRTATEVVVTAEAVAEVAADDADQPAAKEKAAEAKKTARAQTRSAASTRKTRS
ncbi:hypothetical protein [Actinomadura atramentaria]|uniref:hypothetical protein n=1 Tax=Actinomadura atramentaria TaxID=1990 RepID=UPI0003701FE2|nr:hypothetical protein [Actinomadura atramentaria]